MVLDKKKFNDTITSACNIAVSNKNKKQCINDIKKCSDSNTKCKNEYINKFSATPKKEDILKCFTASKNPNKCLDSLKKKTNYNELSAKAGHCISNKCPEIYNNTKKILQKLLKSPTKQNNNVINTKCKKESDVINNIFMKINECNKKYDTFNEQQKCSGVKKMSYNYIKYYKRHASKNISSILKTSKQSKKTKTSK